MYRILKYAQRAGFHVDGTKVFASITDEDVPEDITELLNNFAKILITESASVVANTNLEDVEGGDCAVLHEASEQLKDYFRLEE